MTEIITPHPSEGIAGNILLTGSSGFIGREMVQQLQACDIRPRTLLRPQQDLRIADSLLPACEDINTIIHLAACAHVNRLDTDTLYQTNVTGTANLLQAAITQGVRRLVFVSSILADPAHDQPRSAYGDAKWQAEQLLRRAHAGGAIEVCMVRPVNVYGPGMKGNLMSLLRLISKGLMPPLPAFDQHFSLVGIEDLCQAIRLAATRASERQNPEQAIRYEIRNETSLVYPVTDGQSYTIKAIERAMREALGKPQRKWATPAPLFYLGALGMEAAGRVLRLKNAPGLRSWYALTRNRLVDDRVSRQELGYNPRVSFYSSLPAILEEAGLDPYNRSV